jgi:hypothetical protein
MLPKAANKRSQTGISEGGWGMERWSLTFMFNVWLDKLL